MILRSDQPGEVLLDSPVEIVRPPARHTGMPVWTKLIIASILIAVGAIAIWRGVELRRDAWTYTEGVRFEGDVMNGWAWGTAANKVGVFNLYDFVARGHSYGQLSELDYTPLRIAVVAGWQKFTNWRFPGTQNWGSDYEITRPMLMLNQTAELVSVGLIFLIIWLWTIRSKRNEPRTEHERLRFAVAAFLVGIALSFVIYRFERSGFADPTASVTYERVIQWWPLPLFLGAIALASVFRGVAPALAGALIFWFNPAVIWDGHVWPQWDIWLVPFFLAAVLLASVDWWFCAGVCITLGASLKGQMLLGAPILLIWPICQLRFGAVMRLIAGISLSFAAIALPWMHVPVPGLVQFMLLLLAMGLVMPFVVRFKINPTWLAISIVLLLGLAWPWKSTADSVGLRLLPLAILGFVALSRFLPYKLILHCYALGIAAAVFLLIPLYGAHDTWWQIGFNRASEQFHSMVSGRGGMNLPGLFQSWMRWPPTVDAATHVFWQDAPIKFRSVMIICYATCLVLMGTGAAINARRGDARFLVAMAAPWVLAYLFMTQMHGRYLVWGAAMCALLAGASGGLALLGVVVSFLAWFSMLFNQYYFTPSWDPVHMAMLRQVIPHLGWMLVLIGAILLYFAVVPRRRPDLRRLPALPSADAPPI